MTTKRLRVGIIFGGRSGEHEVSLLSAQSVAGALDSTKFEAVMIGIDKKGHWKLASPQQFLEPSSPKTLPRLKAELGQVQVVPGDKNKGLQVAASKDALGTLDVVFPVLHGTYGEDGTIQGLLKIMDLPFVGPGVLTSAIGMDKDISKRLWRDLGLPMGKFQVFHRHQKKQIQFKNLVETLGLPFFLKPVNAGSSIGVHKIKSEKDLSPAIEDALQYDNKLLCEEFIEGREIEVSVLGNENPKASLPGELIPMHEFYSYEAKYLDENGAKFEIPAKLPPETIKEVQRIAIEAFRCVSGEGMARVDFFLRKDGKLFLNEINTIPGFTSISMYPKMWEATGLSFTALITELIELAIQRHQRDSALKTEFSC